MTHSYTIKVFTLILALIFVVPPLALASNGHSSGELRQRRMAYGAKDLNKKEIILPKKERKKIIPRMGRSKLSSKMSNHREVMKRKEFDKARKDYLMNSKNMTMKEREKATQHLRELGKRWNTDH